MSETPERRARLQIDAQLSAAGWTVQDIATLNLSASRGVAVCEMQSMGAFATDDPAAYLDAWQSVDSDEEVPLAVARKAFGGDPKDFIEELNKVLVA